MNRRRFLQALAAASTTPIWLRYADQAAWAGTAGDGRVRTRTGGMLLAVYLAGGNDPLNTVVPYLDTAYTRMRPSLALRESQVLPMGNGFGLHASLPTFHQFWNAGQLAVVQQVGSAGNDFSHFTNNDIWQTASVNRRFVDGWLGRYLGNTSSSASGPVRAVALGDLMPTALEGRGTGTVSVESIADFAFKDTDAPDAQLRHGTYMSYAQVASSGNAIRDAVVRSQRDLTATLDPVQAAHARYNAKGAAPSPGEAVAQMFAAGVGTEIGFISLPGFDTHTDQLRHHGPRLAELDGVVRDFFASANKLGVADRSSVLVFSEFGRRVPQNGSLGTDHGDAGSVFVIGPRVRGGLYGPRLDLSQLKDGNLPVRVDLRNVYASVLENWLGVSHTPILGGRFTTLPLFA